MIFKAIEINKGNSWDSLMAGHTIKIRAVDTVKETTSKGSIWGKMYIKGNIGITTLIV